MQQKSRKTEVSIFQKVNGFRFDLMGHIMKSTMVHNPHLTAVKAKSTLQSLSKDKDGVDGSMIYMIKPRLANPSFKPQKHHILAAVDNFVDLLKIRYSSPLFRLRTANAIQVQLFTTDITYLSGVRSYTNVYGVGPPWVQGIIVMSIEDGDAEKPGMAQIDPFYSLVVVLFNVCPAQVSLEIPALKSRTLQLHPVQLNSVDDVVKQSAYDASSCSFIIPQRTTSLFVELRNTWINLLFSLSLLLFFFNSKIIMC
ncbi:hypothetical protein ZIOFF_040047 [Zingiber officinale]|uniref:Alpha-1,6-glucosidases pullulanase-type C-terminal domain-containing protein n=1 Tax=Zingiber officinale TaxID=94328 RepID=A0A8J5G4D5_ZINOF|nr:hypothetical protein ZIOFF_040047 [Zingiber officinale]